MGKTIMEIWLVSLLLMTGIIILIVTVQLNSILGKLVKLGHSSQEPLSWWDSFTGLKPLEKEHDLIIPQAHDGIYELDNPTPPWFMYLFYLSILFGIAYGTYYHVYLDGSIQEAEYKAEILFAEKEHDLYTKKFASAVNEQNVTLNTSKKDLKEGSNIYNTHCVACHGDKGQGGIGPNITDRFWLHGGGIKDLFKTITVGVPEKGMIAWNKTLNPIQIQHVASYVLSLQDTNPKGAKEPQGIKTN